MIHIINPECVLTREQKVLASRVGGFGVDIYQWYLTGLYISVVPNWFIYISGT